MKEYAALAARDWLTMGLAGLGISLAPHEFFGGLFLAMAAASLIATRRRIGMRLASVLATAALVSVVAVLISQEFNHWDVKPQLIMLCAGAVSGWAVNFFIKLMDEAQERSERIVDRIIDRILPPNRKD